jgi:hypothetical protein
MVCVTIVALLLGYDEKNSCEQKDRKNFHIKLQVKLSNVNGDINGLKIFRNTGQKTISRMSGERCPTNAQGRW